MQAGTVYVGDCVAVMRSWPDECVDAVVCDPPYHLTATTKRFGKPGSAPAKGPAYQRHNAGFMGQDWDGGDVAFRVETWAEVLRVLKPGGHLLAFGGTRTYHRLACAVEDAGFEIRDTLAWMYGSGFPKSLDVSKAIDKAAGAAREVVGTKLGQPGYSLTDGNGDHRTYGRGLGNTGSGDAECAITAPATEAARRWQGWGTALKPAYEPIVLARKPLSEGSVAANVLRHGTGAINVDGCRIHTEGSEAKPYTVTRLKPGATLNKTGGNWRPEEGGVEYHGETKAGRWPANVVLDEEAAAMLDEHSGVRTSGFMAAGTRREGNGYHGALGNRVRNDTHGDSGGASRFFYTAKADTKERSEGLGGRNTHPTVKPIDLMAWLIKLVTPPGGVVLDPFLGSGSTAVAAQGAGFQWVGIENSREYAEIAQQRVGMFARVVAQ